MVEGDLILNRYRPIELAGEGGSATVELCWDTRIQRRVAIKRLPLVTSGDGSSVPGLAEARLGAMLKHPSIVSVYDFETTLDEAYLIMEAIEGPTLTQVIDDEPDHMLDLDTVAAVASAVGGALDFAHGNQLLHLDIKPDNILIDRNGQVKVSDFGVSELVDAQGITAASGGTIGYMPPEQMLGADLDQRCDEFAFAMVVYEMLCGERPFKAPTIEESIQLIERFQITPPSYLRADVDAHLDDVILIALDPQREARYGSVSEFTAALMPYLGSVRAGTRELREAAGGGDADKTIVLSNGATVPQGRDGTVFLQRTEEAHGEEDDADERPATTRTRRPSRKRMVIARILAFALCFALGALGIVPLHIADTWSSLGMAACIGIAACILPAGGSVFALGAYGIAQLYSAAAPVLAGTTPHVEWGVFAMGLAWLLSALLLSWACTRQRRVSSVLAAVLAAAAPVGGFALLNMYATSRAAELDADWTVAALAVTVCLIVVGALVRPLRRKEK